MTHDWKPSGCTPSSIQMAVEGFIRSESSRLAHQSIPQKSAQVVRELTQLCSTDARLVHVFSLKTSGTPSKISRFPRTLRGLLLAE